jgi:hypothetical protein
VDAFQEVDLKLRSEPVTYKTMSRLSDLNNEEKLLKLKNKLFYPIEQKTDDRPVVFKYLLFKIALTPGSTESIDFHKALGELNDNLIYTSESITTLLQYKLGTVRHMQTFFFLLFLAYMVCVLTTKDYYVYIGWCIFHFLTEFYQFTSIKNKLSYF